MSSCVSRKKMYASHASAVDALIDARTRFDYAAQHGPIAVYRCEDCGQFHLTSKGKMDETLEKHLAEGKIRLQKEANRWIDKLKKS